MGAFAWSPCGLGIIAQIKIITLSGLICMHNVLSIRITEENMIGCFVEFEMMFPELEQLLN